MKRLLSVMQVPALLAVMATAQASGPAPAGSGQASFPSHKNVPKYRPGTLLVRFKAKASVQQVAIAHAAAQAQVVRKYHVVPNLHRVRLAEGMSVMRALRAYRQNSAVQYAEPDFAVQAVGVNPNDPSYVDGTQWALHNTGQNGGTAGADIDAPDAWSITTGSSSVVVGDIDTGIDYNHPDLAANVWSAPFSFSVTASDGSVITCPAGSHGFNAVYSSCDPMDDAGHGTHTAGTMAAGGNNGIGVAGVNWNVTVVACKFLDASGAGWTSDAITCLEFLKDLKDNHGLNLVATNNSWGGWDFSQALMDAIDAQRQSGILLMAAAGNAALDDDANGFYPADYVLPNLIAVAATDRNDVLATFSDYGKHSVHLGAPGVSIISTTPDNSYSTWNGTSMATPHVTGVAALLKAQDPSRDWLAIRNLILAGGDNKPSLVNTITGKRLNAYGAMTCSNSEVLAWLQPRTNVVFTGAGEALLLSVLHINCAAPGGDVQVTIDPGGTVLTLKDDGVAPDQAAGDGIYTGQFTPSANGTFTATLANGDSININIASYSFQTTTYDYRTITGTNLNFTDDEVAQITPSFPTPFGGGSFNSLWVSANGTISIDSPFSDWYVQSLPVAGPSTLVAPFWTDFVESGAQNVFWAESGTAPNREVVIEWRDVYLFCPWADDNGNCLFYPDESVRFQVVFFESKSDILFNYAHTTFGGISAFADNGAISSVGVQVGPSSANQFSFYQPALADNMALLWSISGPQIYSVAPASAIQGAPDFTLTVNGANFAQDAVVRWYGAPKPTTFVSSTQLTAAISAADLCHAGTDSQAVRVVSAGLTSNGAPFTVTAPYLSTLAPGAVAAGGPGFNLTAIGGNFFDGTVLTWNGSPRPTTFVNASQVTAAISASDIATPGTVEVVPTNLPGCTANIQGLPVRVEAPAISSLAPSTATAGGPAFTLTVNGSFLGGFFVDGSVVRWNGSARPTTFVNSGQLTAAISAADIAVPVGTLVNVTVVNPGGVTSDPAAFTVSPPVISSIAPSSVAAGSPGVTLTINGSNFANGAIVDFSADGCCYDQAFPTTFVSSGQLTAVIDSYSLGLINEWGLNFVSVWDPGGGVSNAVTFSVNGPAIGGLLPSSATAGGPGFTLTVNGSYFVNGSVVNWNGSARPTTFVNGGQLTASISAADIANPGTVVSVTVVNPGDAGSNAIAFTVLPNFSLTRGANQVRAMVPGQTSPSFDLMVTGGSSFSSPVTLACLSGLPAGAACGFSQNNFVPSVSGTAVTVTVATTQNTTPTGNYQFTVQGSAGGATMPADGPFTLEVQDYSIAPSPDTQVITPGNSASFTILDTALNGFAASPTLACPSPLPTGMACNFSPSNTVSPGSSVTLTVTTTTSTPVQNNVFAITASANDGAGTVTRTAYLNPNVQSFTQAVTPASQAVPAGTSATYTASYTAQNGFSAPITVGCTGLAAGMTCTPSPNPVTPGTPSMVTVSTTAGVTPSTVNFSITGTGLGLTQSTPVTLTLQVQDYTFAPSGSTTITVTHGSSQQVSMTLQGANGFSGNVTFSCAVSAALAGVTCTLPSPNPMAVSGSMVNATFTINASATAKRSPRPESPPTFFAWMGGGTTLIAGFLLLGGDDRKRWSASKKTVAAATFLAMLLLAAMLAGCGGGGGGGGGVNPPPAFRPESGTVTLQASSGGNVHTVTLNANVN